ncbi:Uncharacterised protein [Serratia entomophila]|nr:Uncharacterised protein [Serratia entomophila]CAI1850496.1 Uncharacterised protein [Serratia entomophila]CAI1883709.1 Uncharacterised protein [Serratia entomophila]
MRVKLLEPSSKFTDIVQRQKISKPVCAISTRKAYVCKNVSSMETIINHYLISTCRYIQTVIG